MNRIGNNSAESVFNLQDREVLYRVLNVTRKATPREIKRAYYTLAILYHPDKNSEGEELFKEISFAHSILSDEQQRRMYDAGTLRSYLHGMARSYDPAMDLSVQLSPEDLRQFVERLQREHMAKKEKLSLFDQRRDEELQRRAEYDAAHPEFKAQYEQERLKRMAQLAKGTPSLSSRVQEEQQQQHESLVNKEATNNRISYCSKTHDSNSSSNRGSIINNNYNGNFNEKSSNGCSDVNNNFVQSSCHINGLATNKYTSSSSLLRLSSECMHDVKPFRTSAELVASIQEEEQRRLYGERVSQPSQPAVRLRSIKEQMMREYYKSHDAESSVINTNSCNSSEMYDHDSKNDNYTGRNNKQEYINGNSNNNNYYSERNGWAKNKEYSNTIAEKLRTCVNFDYLDFVEHDKEDKELIEDAILADALGHYSRYH